ncbi:MAG: prolyl-tRNA synthetase [Candidatus Zambryskibacteria bacterium]|nr:prolyl-tRNA synthetase [Candidatus Zambryskibacteria bacterium]
MRQSKLFTKTRKETPVDEISKNAQLLIKAGFIYKEMSGVYAMLPLGLLTLNKIINIIREEMNGIGGQELSLTALQEKELWEKTNRWDDAVVDNWFKTKLKNDTEVGLGFTHEEPLTRLMKDHISSYRDLPLYAYQFQTKFRNEIRAKSGIMRTREFIMKDLYSFSKDEKEHMEFYEKAKQAYKNIFVRAGLGDLTYLTFASGGVFSKYSHEFQTISDSGEDIVYINKDDLGAGLNMDSRHAVLNKEVYTEEVKKELNLSGDFEENKAVEVGNIFTLGTRFSEALGLTYKDEDGKEVPVFMGSYGIGPARLMGVIAEVFSDDKGLVWPREVAPYEVHLVKLGVNPEVSDFADRLYEDLKSKGVSVLYDDRDLRPGEKFADSDLIGIPVRFVVSDKTLAVEKIEVKYRNKTDTELMLEADALKILN